VAEHVHRFTEALEIWDRLQQEERTTYEGQHYQIVDAPFEPKPLQQPRMPVLIGGSGPRMLRLTGAKADGCLSMAQATTLEKASDKASKAPATNGAMRRPASVAQRRSARSTGTPSVDERSTASAICSRASASSTSHGRSPRCSPTRG
jgi:alkanesulfonate monooxygenase SsuD/methylene tetrahydromethanopterin reductase-like flavin-dependent oxidoreductase (luciferase family)